MAEKKHNKARFHKLKTSWQQALARLIPLGGVSANNKVRVFHEGDAAFLAIYEAINAAKRSIWIETYILVPDRLGKWLGEALIKASKRGVKVRILYDHFGSAGLDSAFLSSLKKADIDVQAFNPIWPWRRRGPLFFRNHRKIIIVDEEVGFCGGMNISEDYAGPTLGNGRFRDSMVELRGPSVLHLKELAKASLSANTLPNNTSTKKRPRFRRKFVQNLLDRFFTRSSFVEEIYKKPGVVVQVLGSNTRKNLNHIQRSMHTCLRKATSYCYLSSPYFLPFAELRKALKDAKKRGVDVRVLTAGLSDVPLMRYAGRHVYKTLLRSGVRIYEMHIKTLHAKTASIDGMYGSIGSYNLDHWSARRNLEVNVSFLDSEIATQLKKQFENDLSLAEEINAKEFMSRSFFRRFLCWCAYQIMSL